MSTNITLEFLATKSKLKQENPIQSSLDISKKYVPRPLEILKFWNIFLECKFSSQNWHAVMSGNKETALVSACWVAGEAPHQLRDSAPHISLSACESIPAAVTSYVADN